MNYIRNYDELYFNHVLAIVGNMRLKRKQMNRYYLKFNQMRYKNLK